MYWSRCPLRFGRTLIGSKLSINENPGSIEILGLRISLQSSRRRLAGRGHKPRPNHSAGGPKDRLAASRKKKRKEVQVCIYSARLQSNDISISSC
jgi:hypothetical protein